MRTTLLKLLTLCSAIMLPSFTAAASILYNQPYDGTGNVQASQNDTTLGGLGRFATSYDNFALGGSGQYDITDLSFTGGYFVTATPGNTTAFEIGLYSDNSGQPGSLLWSATFPGNANESCGGSGFGGPICTYDLGLNFIVNAGTEYWISIVADLAYPPQWGWAEGTGDASSYLDFGGTRSHESADRAFSLAGNRAAVPEPSSWIMMLIGFAAIGAGLRRNLTKIGIA